VQFGSALRVNFEFTGLEFAQQFVRKPHVVALLRQADVIVSNIDATTIARTLADTGIDARLLMMSALMARESITPKRSSKDSTLCNWAQHRALTEAALAPLKQYNVEGLPVEHLVCGRLDARAQNRLFPDDHHLCLPGPHIDLLSLLLRDVVGTCCK
jgi:hypothetical protein